MVAKNEDTERRFQAQLQGIDLPQTVFDPDEIPEGFTAGQLQQRQTSMRKAKALRDHLRAQRRGA